MANATLNFHPTAGELTSSGLTLIPGRVSLYSCAAFPGLLLKKVASVEEALQLGGVFVASPARRLAYIGRTAWSAFNASVIGSVLLPNAVTPVRAGPEQNWQGAGTFMQGAIATVSGYAVTPYITNGVGMAIVTKAKDGLLHQDTGTALSTGAFNWATGVSNLPAQGAATVNPTMVKSPLSPITYCTATISLTARGGFISFAADVPLYDVVSKGRLAMLAVVDDAVREDYTVAFDTIRASIDKNLKIADSVKLFLQVDGTWAANLPIKRNFTYSNGPVRPTFCFMRGTNMPYGSARPDVRSRYDCVMSAWPIGTLIPACNYRLQEIGLADAAVYFEDLTADVGALAFSALSVVPRFAKLSEAQPRVDLGAIIAPMLMLAKPAEVRTNDIFDLDAQRRAEFAVLDVATDNMPVVDTNGVNEAEVTAKVTALSSKWTDTQITRAALRVHCSRNVRYIDQFIADVDSLVRETVG